MSNLDFKTPALCLCCLLSTAYLWGLTFSSGQRSELKDSVDHASWGYGVYMTWNNHSRRCGLEMSIGLTRLNTSKAFHGAASCASWIFRSDKARTQIAPFWNFIQRPPYFKPRLLLVCLPGLFLNRISKATSQFSNLQKIASILARQAKWASKANALQSTLFVSSCCFVILGVSVKPLHSPQTCFFFLFLFLKWEANMRIESRGGEGGGVAYQTEVAYICDHGPMFFSVCC